MCKTIFDMPNDRINPCVKCGSNNIHIGEPEYSSTELILAGVCLDCGERAYAASNWIFAKATLIAYWNLHNYNESCD